ncbi:MAG: substrate-binding domain-containing protein [Ktedonobacterales bacterium]|nr:substrate-binding domain-containing protein [Ktedonobacterales bacterium]
MQLNPSRLIKVSALAATLVATTALSACGSSSGAAAPINGKNCHKVGVLLPESASSARWEGKDRPALLAALSKTFDPKDIIISNANGSDDTQFTQAQAAITQGACILIVAPHDSAKAAQIVQEAKKSQIPVIAYDRLIKDPDLNFYVSFDNVSVGKAQGDYIAANYTKYVAAGKNNIVFINGSQDDNNAVLFHDGVHKVLDDLINGGKLVSKFETYTPNWDNPTAQTEMEQALTKTNNNIQIAYVANDGMAGTVIAALKAQKLNGKVLVTGQDATAAGVQQILLGNQNMTVYKPIVKEAQGAADLAAALSAGTDTTTLASATTTNGSASTPSVLLQVISVDINNVASTVIADNYVTKAEACTGVPAGTYGPVTCP